MPITDIEPFLPDRAPLEELAVSVIRAASGLGDGLPDQTRSALADLVRLTSAHYSPSIDGHTPHPLFIERALRSDFSEDPSERALQREAVAHIRTSRIIESRVANDASIELTSPGVLKAIHWEFFVRQPEEFRWIRDPQDPARQIRVAPGEFRAHPASSGPRNAPPAAEIVAMMERFRTAYDPRRLDPIDRILAIAASHHRLFWIHPFTAGNGTVTRIFSAAFAERAGVDGSIGGLWTVNRGLARNRVKYRALLAAADEMRRDELIGRTSLSQKALTAFCRFYLETCLEEIRFMRSAVSMSAFGERLRVYGGLRSVGMASGEKLRAEAGLLLREVAWRGEVPRGEAGRIMSMAPSEARRVLGALVKERILTSETPKGPVRLCIPAHAAPFFMPDLFSPELLLQDAPRSIIDAA